MNKKIIVFIILTLLIGTIIFVSLSREKTRAEILNERLRAENASWVAKDYPEEIMNIPLIYDLPEDTTIDEKLFSIDNEKDFFPEEANTDDLNLEKKSNNTASTGMIVLATNLEYHVNYKLDDKWSWKEYLTTEKSQSNCGACQVFAVLGALEGYANKKYRLTGKNKLNLSEQYLVSYSNFKGCAGAIARYYLNLITLPGYDSKNQNLDDYFKARIIKEINNGTKLDKDNNLETKTQLALAVGEVPFGVPLENQLKYLSYDSCEIVKLDNSGKPITGMNISSLTMYTKENLTIEFCRDNSDLDTIIENGVSVPTDIKNKIFIPTRKDELNKYFIEDFFQIDYKDCKKENSKTVANIKAALKYTPVIASIGYYDSMTNYKDGIWIKDVDGLDKNKSPGGHAVIIAGYGVDDITGKEYWIIKNSFSDTWGDNGYFRVWIQDKDTELECRRLFGFSGELVQKPGAEINALFPEAKIMAEAEKLAEEKRIEEGIKEMKNEYPQPITPTPENPYKARPEDEYNIINISSENQTTTEICVSVEQCIYNKLNSFYGNTTTTTGENKLT